MEAPTRDPILHLLPYSHKWLDGWQESWVNCPVRTFFSLCTTPLKLRLQISCWNKGKKILVRWSNSSQTLPSRPTKKSISTLKWLNTHFYNPFGHWLVINFFQWDRKTQLLISVIENVCLTSMFCKSTHPSMCHSVEQSCELLILEHCHFKQTRSCSKPFLCAPYRLSVNSELNIFTKPQKIWFLWKGGQIICVIENGKNLILKTWNF